MLNVDNEIEKPIERSPLLPDRYPTPDFFVCDIFDAAPKGDVASMEHPVFSLSTKPDHRIRKYQHNNSWIEVRPSSSGLSTVHDRDVLIYCISQLIAASNEDKPISKVVRFRARDLLIATNRSTSGRGYELLKVSFSRLQGTQIATNIVTDGHEEHDLFSLIDRAKIIRETRDGRMQEVEITLSDWVFNAIRAKEVLTLSKDYFRLRKPLERRIYEIARKHCGRKDEWRISLPLLMKKCGSGSTLKEFKRLVKKIVDEDHVHNHIPDYSIFLLESVNGTKPDQIVFKSRQTVGPLRGTPQIANTAVDAEPPTLPQFTDTEIYNRAREVAPGWDPYLLEQEWRQWSKTQWLKGNPLRQEVDVEDAFIRFCAKRFEMQGRPK